MKNMENKSRASNTSVTKSHCKLTETMCDVKPLYVIKVTFLQITKGTENLRNGAQSCTH